MTQTITVILPLVIKSTLLWNKHYVHIVHTILSAVRDNSNITQLKEQASYKLLYRNKKTVYMYVAMYT